MIWLQHFITEISNKCTYKVSVDTVLSSILRTSKMWDLDKNKNLRYSVKVQFCPLWPLVARKRKELHKIRQYLSVSSYQDEFKETIPIKMEWKMKIWDTLQKCNFWPPLAPYRSRSVRVIQNLIAGRSDKFLWGIHWKKLHQNRN